MSITMQTVTVENLDPVTSRPSNGADQGAMIDVKPLPEEDPNIFFTIKFSRKGTTFFVILGIIILAIGIALPLVLKPKSDAKEDDEKTYKKNVKEVADAFIAFGVIVFLCAVLVYQRYEHTDEVIITETRYVRRIGTNCDLRFKNCGVNLRLAATQTQYNMDFLTGVELRTSSSNDLVIAAIVLTVLSLALAFIIKPDQMFYSAVCIIIMVTAVTMYPLYVFASTRGRQAFVRFSFSRGLEAESDGVVGPEATTAFIKRIMFKYPVYEDSIIVPLDLGGKLYSELSSLRLKAVARMAKM
jgi:hypothetical protein